MSQNCGLSRLYRVLFATTIVLLLLLVFTNPAFAVGSYNVNLNSASYTSSNWFNNANLRGQCTWYAWGRANELYGVDVPCRNNAHTWNEVAQNNGWSVGTTPQAHSIAVFETSTTGNNTGHVAFVESYDGTLLYISEANWNNPYTQNFGEDGYSEGYFNLSTGIYQGTYNDRTKYSRGRPDWYIYIQPPTSYLDVNGYLDGKESGDLGNYGTCDVYVNGQLYLDDCNDFYSINGSWRVGTPYEIKDIKATSGHTYLGVHSGSTSGTITAGGTFVRLSFATTYTVSFNANGGATPPSSQTKVHGTTLKLTTNTPSREGYQFLSWNTKADGTGTSYAPGANYTSNSFVTLYAQWQSLTYTISYDANGGINAPPERTVEGGGAITLPLDQPSWEGHDFLGWNTNPEASTPLYLSGDEYPGGAATLYAIWQIQSFTVSFDSAGGGNFEPVTVDYGNTIPNLPTPERHGLFFIGWFTADNQQITSSSIIKSALNLTAHWSKPTSMTLPAAITTIEDETFEGIDTNVIYVPSTVTSMGSKAFANNSNLYSVIVYSQNVSPKSDTFVNCPNLTIYGYEDTPIHYYAVAKKIPFEPIATSDWVLESEVPIGATLTGEEKWEYDHVITETTTSLETSLEGWEQVPDQFTWEQTESEINRYVDFTGIDFSTSHTLYNKYNTRLTNNTNGNVKIEVGESSGTGAYIYYHWTLGDEWPGKAAEAGHAINVYVERAHGPNPDGYTYTLFHAFETNALLTPVEGKTNSNDYANLTGEGIYSTCYVDAYNLAEYVSYWWYITEIKQQPYTKYQKRFTYTRQTTETLTSTTPVVPGEDIQNIKHYVKYGF